MPADWDAQDEQSAQLRKSELQESDFVVHPTPIGKRNDDDSLVSNADSCCESVQPAASQADIPVRSVAKAAVPSEAAAVQRFGSADGESNQQDLYESQIYLADLKARTESLLKQL